ncbi:MAG: GNAT family N-acetyltransferase [Candidatus Vogelbacteria bacterium]|nr:GNAT family N-acetyltransferase [Candidatus Vogelbacteria bacterium]
MTTEIKILIAKVEDREQIGEVFDRVWLATYPNEEYKITVDDILDHIEKRRQRIRESREDRIKNPLKGETLLVAQEDDKVVGVCRLVVKDDRNQLQAIYVLPDYQGRGIGTMFWWEAQKYTDPKKDFFVELAVYNTNALEFYKKLGFVDTGRRMRDEKLRMKSGSIIPEMEMVKLSSRK